MRRTRGLLSSERGATLALVAVSMFLFLGLAALAIDLGMIKASGAQAQSAVDAAALAGASAFVQPISADTVVLDSVAYARALDYVTRQAIRGVPIDPATDSVAIKPIADSQKVRVTVLRRGVSTWFANTFGISSVRVSKHAAAVAAPAGQTPCIKPFAVPDLWDEEDPPSGNGSNRVTGDTDHDHIWDADESWRFSTSGADRYGRWNPATEGQSGVVQTGYGSAFRGANRDFGLQMNIKAQAPGGSLGPGFFYLLRLQDSQGGNDIYNNILGCAPGTFSLDSTYRIEGGDKVGPTNHAIEDLLALDRNATWDVANNTVRNSLYEQNWQASPRVIKVGLFDPNQIGGIESQGNGCNGNCTLRFQNIALMFLEGTQGSGQNEYVKARFLGYTAGSGTPGAAGSGGAFPKRLRLVE